MLVIKVLINKLHNQQWENVVGDVDDHDVMQHTEAFILISLTWTTWKKWQEFFCVMSSNLTTYSYMTFA